MHVIGNQFSSKTPKWCVLLYGPINSLSGYNIPAGGRRGPIEMFFPFIFQILTEIHQFVFFLSVHTPEMSIDLMFIWFVSPILLFFQRNSELGVVAHKCYIKLPNGICHIIGYFNNSCLIWRIEHNKLVVNISPLLILQINFIFTIACMFASQHQRFYPIFK